MVTYEKFIQKFKAKKNQQKQIGLEIELPIVQRNGEAVPYIIIQKLFAYLEKYEFEITNENGIVLEVSRQYNEQYRTIITTDLGYSTLEIILPPLNNLYDAQYHFKGLIDLLLPFFEKENCLLLGYGVHPLTFPNRKLLAPRKRYRGLEKIWNTNTVIPKSMGNDAHLLTISAGNQCHVDVSETEAVQAINVLNASSGLQIALQANSPIWKGKVVENYKAIREKFYDFLFLEEVQRNGVAPKFETLLDYFQHVSHQTLFLVIRNQEVLQIFKYTFADYLEQKSVEATNLNGETVTIIPDSSDIHYHKTLFYWNARLVPNYGTIEVRMPCQQPPKDTLVTAALNLGLMENLREAEAFINQYDWTVWKHLRTQAIRYAFEAKLPNGESIVPLIRQLLMIAKTGLEKRGLNEAPFLNPLFERLEKQQSPADVAIDIFKKEGMTGLLNAVSFTATTSAHSVIKPLQEALVK
jgi:glutamate--cysteine ligase